MHWRSRSEHLLTLRDPRRLVSEIDHTTISAWSEPVVPAEPVLSCTTLGSQGTQNPCVRQDSCGQGRCRSMAQVSWWTLKWQIIETQLSFQYFCFSLEVCFIPFFALNWTEEKEFDIPNKNIYIILQKAQKTTVQISCTLPRCRKEQWKNNNNNETTVFNPLSSTYRSLHSCDLKSARVSKGLVAQHTTSKDTSQDKSLDRIFWHS